MVKPVIDLEMANSLKAAQQGQAASEGTPSKDHSESTGEVTERTLDCTRGGKWLLFVLGLVIAAFVATHVILMQLFDQVGQPKGMGRTTFFINFMGTFGIVTGIVIGTLFQAVQCARLGVGLGFVKPERLSRPSPIQPNVRGWCTIIGALIVSGIVTACLVATQVCLDKVSPGTAFFSVVSIYGGTWVLLSAVLFGASEWPCLAGTLGLVTAGYRRFPTYPGQ